MALNPDCGGHTVVVPGVIHLNLMVFASEEVTAVLLRTMTKTLFFSLGTYFVWKRLALDSIA